MTDKILKGRKCVVTGGGSGIGRGIALALAKVGADVIVTGRRAAMLEETVALLQAAGVTTPAARISSQVMDVCDSASVASGMQAAKEALGSIDVLVNNAGVGGPNACAGEGPDRWDTVIRTNLDGVFFASREALKHMPDGGRVINIASVLGQFGVPGYTAYCASKHGVIGFTKALALEVAPRQITVNAICPGWVETDMAREGIELMAEGMGISLEAARAEAISMVPMGRILEPREIGELVVYLASEAAAGMTAQALNLCGGQVMNG